MSEAMVEALEAPLAVPHIVVPPGRQGVSLAMSLKIQEDETPGPKAEPEQLEIVALGLPVAPYSCAARLYKV
jgi:hypothetical protein